MATTNKTSLTQEQIKSIGQAGMGMSIIGALSDISTAFLTSRNQRIQAKWAARIAEENQRMSQLAAEDALLQSQYRVGGISMKTQALKSSQRVALAANGVSLSSASVAEVLTSTDVLAEESMRIEALNGYRAAWGLRMQGNNYIAQAGALRASAHKDINVSGLAEGFTKGAVRYIDFKAKGIL